MHPFFFTVIGAIFILSLVIVQLSLYGRAKKYLNLLLVIAIFGIVWYAFMYLMTNSGYIRNYPLLFNKGLPLYYLIAPCFYLYVRGSLNHVYSKFRKVDLFHFLIIIPAVISVLPYNLLDYSRQQEIVNKIASDIHFAFSSNKYIVQPWHWFTFPLSALIYSLLQFRLARQAVKKRLNSKTIRWVYLFTSICTLIFVGMLVINISILKDMNNAWFILHQSKLILLMCFCLLIFSLSFFINPELIFGFTKTVESGEHLPLVDSLKNNNTIHTVGSSTIERAKHKIIDENLVHQVELFMIEKEIFRQNGLTLSDLASLLNVPSHKLSDLFNNYYQLNFNTYINNLRITYIKNRLDRGDWKQLTLEAIATDAGFASRNTFFVAFKKAMDKTPSAYLSDLKNA
ncbi:helix-turn-helix domain-containing protein [Pedobacter jamesrossensis]|uniref:Helix-turn-helix domain-containing protein n=1 Tax=Pedobacter jamesrossensis TaxID=1908238 RepID=A0ABV8NQF3_9SPHI